jgi:uncharacterized membrane protein
MDGLEVHLLVNHIPVIGVPIGVLLALGGVIFKNDVIRKTGVVVFLATGLAVFPANFTGEAAEDITEERIANVSHDQIHEHEEASEKAMNLTVVALVLGLVHLFNWPSKKKIRDIIFVGFLVTGIASMVLIGLTAHEGGKIRRPDIYQQ